MNDFQMLELAAKAAGYEIEFIRNSGCFYRCEEEVGREDWNPLDDDGDALRLAANLRLEIIPGKHFGDGCSVNSKRYQAPGVTVFRDSKDMAEQMRRAITMAAAEIGRSME